MLFLYLLCSKYFCLISNLDTIYTRNWEPGEAECFEEEKGGHFSIRNDGFCEYIKFAWDVWMEKSKVRRATQAGKKFSIRMERERETKI